MVKSPWGAEFWLWCCSVLMWDLYLPCLCSRFRSRSHQFASLHLSSIMQVKRTNIEQATRGARVVERVCRRHEQVETQSVCQAWDIWQGVGWVIYWSPWSRSWHRHALNSLQTHLILVVVCLVALYRKPESVPGPGVQQKEEDKERQGRGGTEMKKCIHRPCKYTA